MFALIEFSLVLIPFVFLVARPAATRVQAARAQDWLMRHARQLMAAVALRRRLHGGQRPGARRRAR
jgi:hypothetical protein